MAEIVYFVVTSPSTNRELVSRSLDALATSGEARGLLQVTVLGKHHVPKPVPIELVLRIRRCHFTTAGEFETVLGEVVGTGDSIVIRLGDPAESADGHMVI